MRYDGLKSFFTWLVDEGEMPEPSPMAKVRRPRAPEPVTEVLDIDELRRLLATCDKTTFTGSRDRAIIRIFVDTGVRVGGLVSSTVDEDVDLDAQLLWVRLKGGRRKRLPLGARATQDLERYLRRRRTHRFAEGPQLWLGQHGPLTDSGVRQMIADRGRLAGLRYMSTPTCSATWVHSWHEAGGQDDDLIELTGWTSGKQLARYGRIRREERAQAAHRRLSPRDRV